jgi:hypothetical protein
MWWSAGKMFLKNPDPAFRKYTQFLNIKKASCNLRITST